MSKLSVVLAVRNEEENLGRCLESIRAIADEIVVVDEHSVDKTVEIARKYGAKVYLEPHHAIFHITKQKALDYATGDWILQLDADEVVTKKLAEEIVKVVRGDYKPMENKLFERHQRLIEKRDGKIGKETGEIVGHFIPRRNMFLGKPLIHAGVYPDAAIRLVKKGKAEFPQKSVHEQMKIEGEASWLSGDLLHYDSPTLKRYFDRANRYTELTKSEFAQRKIPKNIFVFIYYTAVKPIYMFLSLYVRHLGFLDGVRGFLWSFYSALHFPIAYFKYWVEREGKK
jgi:glycosyltransferase involved in cell wall biosynthesis